NDFAFDVVVRVENPGANPRGVSIALPWTTRPHWGDTTEKFIGQHPTEVVWSTKGDTVRAEDLTAVAPFETEGEWIATDSVWYLAAFVPRTPGWTLAAWSEGTAAE